MNKDKLIAAIEAKKLGITGELGNSEGYDAGLKTAIAIIRRHYEDKPVVEGEPLQAGADAPKPVVSTKGTRAFAEREWTDDEGRTWRLLDFGYGTASDIRLTLRLGVKFNTAEYSIAPEERLLTAEQRERLIAAMVKAFFSHEDGWLAALTELEKHAVITMREKQEGGAL